jgi:hypothetical protein
MISLSSAFSRRSLAISRAEVPVLSAFRRSRAYTVFTWTPCLAEASATFMPDLMSASRRVWVSWSTCFPIWFS